MASDGSPAACPFEGEDLTIWRPPAPARPAPAAEGKSPPATVPPRIIVVANEKGGAGKSTVAALLSTAMLYQGVRVAVMDVDLRQQTLSNFLANRRRWLPAAKVSAPVPLEFKLADDPADLAEADPARVVALFHKALVLATGSADIVVIDTPGGDTPLSRAAHLQADIVVTPMNDSFVDFDMLGKIDPITLKLVRPSLYARVVHDARRTRAGYGRKLDWVVLRNRMALTDGRNRQRVTVNLEQLADQVGFRLGPPLRERIAYREMFPFGLTLADLSANLRPAEISTPRKAAREELNALLVALNLIDQSEP
ncbi:MAG: division plane positioning ATPase MipZ [Caulobacter sp.]|nr:division plane positioning ATPase MipZ [Caulobacter sp.]